MLPGGKYSIRSHKRYREQSLLAVDMMTNALMQAGVPADAGLTTAMCCCALGLNIAVRIAMVIVV